VHWAAIREGGAMSDFFQNGEIATFHRLIERDVRELEGALEEAATHRPISLVLPYIPFELEGPGLPRIIEELKGVKYLRNIIVAVGRANADEFN
jgi:glucosyl-3-phosphoglycerate synthase